MKWIKPALMAAFILSAIASKAQDYNPYKTIGKKGKVLTLSKGKYVEFFDNDSIQRIGSVLINIKTKKIVRLLKPEDIDKKGPDNSSASRWYSVDPLASKYASYSPYVFAVDNPIRYNDPDGKEVVDPNGKHVSITFNKNGTLRFSKNATADIKRIANALNGTATGRAQLKNAISTDIKVKMNISSETIKDVKRDGAVGYTYGETVQGNYSANDNYGRYETKDGKYSIKEATITVYEGSVQEGIKEGSGRKLEGLTMEQAIGAVAGHEIVHGTDKAEIDKDLKYEMKNNMQTRPNKEDKANKVEDKIIKESNNN